jgi:hypothetical protein
VTPGRLANDAAPTAGATDRHGIARFAFAVVAVVFVGCLFVQVFLVGLDIFADADATIHRDFAYVYGWLTPVLILLSGFAGASKPTRQLTIILVVLFAIQIVLPSLRHTIPILSALHAVNALAIFAVAMMLAGRAIKLLRGESATSAIAP